MTATELITVYSEAELVDVSDRLADLDEKDEVSPVSIEYIISDDELTGDLKMKADMVAGIIDDIALLSKAKVGIKISYHKPGLGTEQYREFKQNAISWTTQSDRLSSLE